MIVVAIIGILAAIAIPNFLRYQLRAKSSEAPSNLKAISVAQESHYAEYGTYVSANAVPAAPPGNARVPWPSGSSFDDLGWSPEGAVHFQYKVTADGAGGGGLRRYTAEARGDVDGDGAPSFWGFVKPGSGGGLDGSFPGTTCTAAGVWDGSGFALGSAGPCDAQSGHSLF